MKMPVKADLAENTSPIKLGRMISTDELGLALHEAATHGEKKKLKRILKTGISVDYPNSAGQTALFCACFEGHDAAVELLLHAGANPNERCIEGSTSVHAAGYSCSPRLLNHLIEAGGDLRLHDNKKRTVKDWVLCQSDHKKRRKMLEYLEKIRHVALSDSSKDVGIERQPSHFCNSLKSENTPTLGQLLRMKSTKSLTLSPAVHNHGYGKIYYGEGEYFGTMATIPLVQESALRHDEYGYTFNNGPFMVMESMLWNRVPVTVKRLHREPPDGGQVDLLITENKHMARLRHPNVLLLMGVCQTNNLEGLVLLYERAGYGSLYSYLYQKAESMDTLTMCEVLKQISEALIYIHQQNLLHCCITSHAVHLVLPNLAKLGNFEYMVENVHTDGIGPHSGVVENKFLNAAYNWTAPEILSGRSPTEKSDLYGLCAVLWEVLHGMPPWSGLHPNEIVVKVVDNQTMLECTDAVKNPFSALLQYGLSVEPKSRQLSLEQFRDILSQVLVDHDSMGIRGDSPHPRRTGRKYNTCGINEVISSTDDETIDNRQKNQRHFSVHESPKAFSQTRVPVHENGSRNIATSPRRDLSAVSKSSPLEEKPQSSSTPKTKLEICCDQVDSCALVDKKTKPSSKDSLALEENMLVETDVEVVSHKTENGEIVKKYNYINDPAKRAFFSDTSCTRASMEALANALMEGKKERNIPVIRSIDSAETSQHDEQPTPDPASLTASLDMQSDFNNDEVKAGAENSQPNATSPINPFKVEFQKGLDSQELVQLYQQTRANLGKPPETHRSKTLESVVVTSDRHMSEPNNTDLAPGRKPSKEFCNKATVYGALSRTFSQAQNQVLHQISTGKSVSNVSCVPSASRVAQEEMIIPQKAIDDNVAPSRTSIFRLQQPGYMFSYTEGTAPYQRMGSNHTAQIHSGTMPCNSHLQTVGSRPGWIASKPASHHIMHATEQKTTLSHPVNFAFPGSGKNSVKLASQCKSTPNVIGKKKSSPILPIKNKNVMHVQDDLDGPTYRVCDHILTSTPHQHIKRRGTPEREEECLGTGNIKNLISSFHDIVEEHSRRQAILVMKSKSRLESNMWLEQTDEAIKHPQSSEVFMHCMGKANNYSSMGKTAMHMIKVVPSDMRNTASDSSTETFQSPQCSSQLQNKCRSSDMSDETDPGIRDVVNEAIRTAHIEVIQKYSDPACPHRPTNLEQFGNTNNNCSGTNTADRYSRPPAACSGKLGICTTRDSEVQTDANFYKRSREVMEAGGEVEEFYFDDILHPDLFREKHMRLQSTMTLDSNSQLESPTSMAQRSSSESWRLSPRPTSGLRDMHIEKHQGDSIIHSKTSSTTHSVGDLTIETDEAGILNVKKKVNLERDAGYTTTVKIESNRNGHHTITSSTRDHATGDAHDEYKGTLTSSKVVASIVLEEKEDYCDEELLI